MGIGARGLLGLALAGALGGAGYLLIVTGMYGLTIFVLIPVLLGALGAWAFRATSGAHAARLGGLTVAAALCSFLVVGAEGLYCIAMAAPLAVPLGALGGWLMYQGHASKFRTQSLWMLLFLPGATVTWDAKAPPQVFEVRSAIEIAAPPEQVWKNVVAYSELPEPQEWYFRDGLGYPQRSWIEGSGVGATRYCGFSTGLLVEPVAAWDEPRLLRFRVTENPAPMREWSPYAHLAPRHLHGYLILKQGQFRLTRMANSHTLLEATTWYQHGLWPAEYWRWWSDAIIHRIHLRVLNHIRTLAESDAGTW
jgi:hypothetical protein